MATISKDIFLLEKLPQGSYIEINQRRSTD